VQEGKAENKISPKRLRRRDREKERTYSIHFLGLVGDLCRLLSLNITLFELRKKSSPIFIS
jgi:hypothetical protein